MKNIFLGLFAAVIVGTAVIAQTPNAPMPQSPQDPKLPSVTLVGCVIQGSGPEVFLLDNARVDAADQPSVTKTYVLASATEDLDIARQLNHEVKVTGIAEAKAVPIPPPGQRPFEKDLPKFSATSVSSIADTCTTAHR